MHSSSLPIPFDKKAMRMNLYDLQVAMSSEYYDQRTRVMRDRVSSQLRLSPRLHSPLSPSFSDDDSSPTNSAFIKYGKNTQLTFKCENSCNKKMIKLKDKRHKHYSKDVVLTGTQYRVESSHVSRRRRLLQQGNDGC